MNNTKLIAAIRAMREAGIAFSGNQHSDHVEMIHALLLACGSDSDALDYYAKTYGCGIEDVVAAYRRYAEDMRFTPVTPEPPQWIPASTPPTEDGEYLTIVVSDVSQEELFSSRTFLNGEWRSGWRVCYWLPIPPMPTGAEHAK